MFLNDIDPHFIKSVNCLYSSDNLVKGETIPLQFYLEEAIKNKAGITKDFSLEVSSSFKYRKASPVSSEFKPFINTLEESKGSSSDNELELDLLKEDLMCIICNGMDVGARNRLLECSDCHMLYHQECHKPIVTNQDSFDSWICQDCKDASKKLKISSSVSSSPTSSRSSSNRHSSSPISKNDKYSKSNSNSSSSSKSSSSSSSPSTTKPATTSSRSNVTPNINIISADKRIQIMKKKAAKLQEKRKHTR